MAEEASPEDIAGKGDEAEAQEPSGPTHEPFALKILSMVSAAQSANGLRHNDHLRYRQYCTRKLRRRYTCLNFKHGKGRYKPTPFPEDFSDVRFIEMLIVQCERAWSYGVQLKADNAAASQHNPRWRHHSLLRFSKAVAHVHQLEAVCKVHADPRTQLEAEAYAAFMEGTYLLEKEEWEDALSKLNRCKRVCDHLGLASEQADAQPFKEKVLEIAPMIRECRYNLGRAFDEDDDDEGEGKATQKAATGPRSKKDLSELSYRGQGLVMPSDKIKGKLMKCLQLVSAIKVSSGEANESVLDSYGALSAEFADVLKDIHTDMIAAGAGGQTSEWRTLEAFARELAVCMNVERNLMLLTNHFDKLKPISELSSFEARRGYRGGYRADEGMRFCDLLKEDVASLHELPETSEPLEATLSAYASVVANCRCFLLSLCNIQLGKTLEAAALLNMLSARVERVDLGDAGAEPLARLHPLFEQVQQSLPTMVGAWRCRLLAQMCMQAQPAAGGASSGGAAAGLQNIAAFSAFPPKFRDIPCKPLLFDLAFPCIEQPDLQDLIAEGKKGPSVLSKVAGGIGSRLGGFFGKK